MKSSARVLACVGVLAAIAMYASPVKYAQAALPVVPGGEGFGMETRAAYGCGASPSIRRVTNLNDSGAGSLRDAVEADGPRVVIFETSGTIQLSSDLSVTSPCLTIAGQTAPSPGITLQGFGIDVLARDVLIQHLRIRPGDGPPLMHETANHDGIMMYQATSNVVLDHNSISWAQGKNTQAFDLGANAAVTFWRNIISEGLYRAKNVAHDPGNPSSLGMLLKQSSAGAPSYISVIGNLFAHNSDRNPEVQGLVNLQFVNNVVFDWGKDETPYQWAMLLASDGVDSPSRVDVVGNVYIAGPLPSPVTPLVAVGTWSVVAGTQVYMADNHIDSSRQPVVDFTYHGYDPRVSSPPVSLAGITVRSPGSVEPWVLSTAGARPIDRDDVDRRIVDEVSARAGQVISSQDQVGGWPYLVQNHRPLTVPGSPHTVTASGYTNLELWLHGFAAAVEGGVVTQQQAPALPRAPSHVRLVF